MASVPFVPATSSFDLTTAFQDLYIVPASRSRAGIDAVTFNNYSSSNVTISIRLIQSGASDVLDEIVTDETIRASKNFLAPSMIGQALLAGGKIQAKVSANSSVNGHITVTEIES